MTVEFLRNNLKNLPEILLQRANSIYLYGSVARGENDGDSDCDLFVCIDDCTDKDLLMITQSVLEWEQKYRCEFSFYQMHKLYDMQRKGSYFLWHIKKEGILLYQRNNFFDNILLELAPYTGAKSDLIEYSEIVEDITRSITVDTSTIEYDLSVLATIARNTCISCCYLLGNMDFGRKSPVEKCIQYWGNIFPFSLVEYSQLYDFRLAAVRGKKSANNPASLDYICRWINVIRELISLALSLVR